MSLLAIPPIEEATDEVKEIFNEITNMRGSVPNGLKLWSVSPRALKAQWAGIKSIFSHPKEEQKLYTIIRYLASDENGCTYCIGLNGSMLMNSYGFTHNELIALQKNPASAPLNEKHKSLLLLALKSIKNPDSVSASDIEQRKQLGITDKEMFDIVLAASHMFVVNTLFKTFKVQAD